MNDRIEREVCEEIEALHEFFVDWFAGTRPQDSLQELFRARFDPGFVLIPPSGALLNLEELGNVLQSAYGSNPEFRIAIRHVSVRRAGNELILATYEEWQRNAKASDPPDNGRITTALFRRGEKLQWVHVHETWLPEAVMAAGPYDF